MSETQAPSLAALLADQEAWRQEGAALTRRIEAAQLPALTAIVDAWNKPTVKTAVAAIEANMAALTDNRLSQAGNVFAVATQSMVFLEAEVARIRDQIEADTAPGEA